MDSRRRMMMGGKKAVYTITYNLSTPSYTYIQINGTGTQYYNTGSFEIEEGNYIYVYAYSGRGSFITLNGTTVATNNGGGINPPSIYYFYPTSNANIKYISYGMTSNNTEIRITTE